MKHVKPVTASVFFWGEAHLFRMCGTGVHVSLSGFDFAWIIWIIVCSKVWNVSFVWYCCHFKQMCFLMMFPDGVSVLWPDVTGCHLQCTGAISFWQQKTSDSQKVTRRHNLECEHMSTEVMRSGYDTRRAWLCFAHRPDQRYIQSWGGSRFCVLRRVVFLNHLPSDIGQCQSLVQWVHAFLCIFGTQLRPIFAISQKQQWSNYQFHSHIWANAMRKQIVHVNSAISGIMMYIVSVMDCHWSFGHFRDVEVVMM